MTGDTSGKSGVRLHHPIRDCEPPVASVAMSEFVFVMSERVERTITSPMFPAPMIPTFMMMFFCKYGRTPASSRAGERIHQA
jgi:hypothetical protein